MAKLKGPVKPARPYRSAGRDQQARATRRAVVAAATRLFVERGYGVTTIDAIAAKAKVSRATVFASVGGKADVLKAAYDIALVGDVEPAALPDRPESRRVIAEADAARMLRGYAAISTAVSGRVAPMYEAVRGAAGTDSGGRAIWDKVRAERRIGARNVIRLVEERGSLRAGLGADKAADIVFAFNDPGLYHLLVRDRGWEIETFEAWLAKTLSQQLLAPAARRLHGSPANLRMEEQL